MKRLALSVVTLSLVCLAATAFAKEHSRHMPASGGTLPCGMQAPPSADAMSPCGMPCQPGMESDGRPIMGTMPRMQMDCGKGCRDMVEMMASGKGDPARMKEMLGLSDDQMKKLRAVQKSMRRELIETGSKIRLAELEKTDLLAQDAVDLGKVEKQLEEAEKGRTRIRMAKIRAGEEIRKILTKEQLQMFKGTMKRHGGAMMMSPGAESDQPAAAPAPAPAAPPAAVPPAGHQH